MPSTQPDETTEHQPTSDVTSNEPGDVLPAVLVDPPKVTYHVVRSQDGDWIAIYRDGVMLEQGHSIQEEDLLRLLGLDFTVEVRDLADEGGSAPFYQKDLG